MFLGSGREDTMPPLSVWRSSSDREGDGMEDSEEEQ